MSAFGPKRTSLVAPHMSAFGGKADIMSAYDQGEHRHYPIDCPLLPWRENEDLLRIEHRRVPPRATCSDAVEANSRLKVDARIDPRCAKRRSQRYVLTPQSKSPR